MTLVPTSYQSEIARRLAEIINILLAVLGRTRDWSPHNPIVNLAFARLYRMVKRLERLATLWQQGKLPKPRKRTQREPEPPEPADPAPPRAPWRKGWVQTVLPSSHMVCGIITAFASDPRVMELVAAAPQAGRILRPLCHMFGADLPDYLRLLPERASRLARRLREKPEPKPAPKPPAYPFPGVPRRWQTRIPGINAPKLKKV